MDRLFFLLFSVATLPALAQPHTVASTAASVEYPKLDTLKFYAVILREELIDDKMFYRVNECPVDKEVFDYYDQFEGNAERCRPCYRKTYNEHEKLISEGPEYAGCAIGKWIEYYPDGKLKVTGHYKVNDTDDWDEIWKRGYCSVQEGIWLYYDENGNVIKIQRYKDGELVD